MFSQKEFIAAYNNEYREQFNPVLFTRNDDSIIEHLKEVILSAQRDKFFTIKVKGFRVIEDYREIYNILYDTEAKTRNKRIKINKFDYIDLKDSEIKLLEVDYHLEANGEKQDIKIYISVPRIVDKYYFRIAGSTYSAMYQIVDGSTYNNSDSSNKKVDQSVTLKTLFAKVTTYIKSYKLKTITDETVPCNCYISDMFGKRFSSIKYFLAKFGYYGTLSFLKLNNILVTLESVEDENYYCFERNNIYVSVPRYYYDNSNVIQSFVYTIVNSVNKIEDFNDIFNVFYWKVKLSNEYKTRTGQNFNNEYQGSSILDSLEHIYDITTHNVIRLPEDQKHDIYCIMRWIMYEFEALKNKNNTDISTKRIRYSEYIASLYAIKLSSNINNISNLGTKVNIKKLMQAICIKYSYLLDQLKTCKLVTFKNSVNDNDALTVLKYTYKGIAGIGEKKSSAVPNKYRFVNASHIGRVDKDSSSNSDPGMSGILCPYATIYENGFLSDFKEPNSWEKNLDMMMNEYRQANGKVELFKAKESLLGTDESNNIDVVESNKDQIHNILDRHVQGELVEETMLGYPLEGSGLICVENSILYEDESTCNLMQSYKCEKGDDDNGCSIN